MNCSHLLVGAVCATFGSLPKQKAESDSIAIVASDRIIAKILFRIRGISKELLDVVR